MNFRLGASLLALAVASAPALVHAQDAVPANNNSRTDAPGTETNAKSSAVTTGDQSAPAGDTTAVPANNDSRIDAPGTETSGQSSAATPDASASGGSDLDTLEPAEDAGATAAPPPPTGDPVLDKLNALQARVDALESRNRQLEAQAAEATTRIEKVEVRAAKSVQMGPAPTFADVTDTFSFKPRGFFQIDYAGYNERAGGYDFNNGTDIRRGRFGFDGTAYKVFKWRIEAEFVKNTVNLLDAYVQYTGQKNLVLTVGQHKAPYGLEANTSDAFNTFIERGMANTAFGSVGAERRVGVSLAYTSDKLNAAIGAFGSGEAIGRNVTTPDEGYGANARITWDPILDAGRVLHVGVSGYRVTNFQANSVTVGDRPNVRVDGGNIESVAIVGTDGPGITPTGAKYATYLGAEAAGVFGPFSVQGEYSHLSIDRFGDVPDANFDGFYVYGTFFVTGESRVFKNGVVDRLKPFKNFSPGGGLGAIELKVRYDQLNLTDHDISPLKKKATTWTGGANWYLNPNVKVIFDWIRFKGTNSPLVALPAAVFGTTSKGDAFVTRLQYDF